MAAGQPTGGLLCFASLLGCVQSFDKSKCKRLLKITMSRIQLLKSRREVQERQARWDVAQLLQIGGQKCEKSLPSRLDRAFKEESMLAAYVKIGEYCQFIKANLSNIKAQKECPMDLREPIACLCYAASCCADLPELQEIREMFMLKYGREFVVAAQNLQPDCHVSKTFLKHLSAKGPSEAERQKLLEDITKEYKVLSNTKIHTSASHGSHVETVPAFANGHSGHGKESDASNAASEKPTIQDENIYRSFNRSSSATESNRAAARQGMPGDHEDGFYQAPRDRKLHSKNETDVMHEKVTRGTDLGSEEQQGLPYHKRILRGHSKRLHRKREVRVDGTSYDDALEGGNDNHRFAEIRAKLVGSWGAVGHKGAVLSGNGDTLATKDNANPGLREATMRTSEKTGGHPPILGYADRSENNKSSMRTSGTSGFSNEPSSMPGYVEKSSAGYNSQPRGLPSGIAGFPNGGHSSMHEHGGASSAERIYGVTGTANGPPSGHRGGDVSSAVDYRRMSRRRRHTSRQYPDVEVKAEAPAQSAAEVNDSLEDRFISGPPVRRPPLLPSSQPPQRPPPPPPYRIASLPSNPTESLPVLPQRSSTFEPNHFRENQDRHVHPRLPQYEDLVARFAALKQKQLHRD